MTGVDASLQPDGWRHWADFERAIERAGKGLFPPEYETLEKDAGRTLGFVRVVAQRTEPAPDNFYDPALGARFGIDR